MGKKLSAKYQKMVQNIYITNILSFVYCAVAAFAVLVICTRSSFLYPFNNWDDVNSYFSMGKGIFNGVVPYRDLFDQKGFYLYFIYGLAYLMSHTTLHGVFIIELISASIDTFIIIRIYKLYMRKELAYIFAPLTLMLMFSTYSFYWGGSAEEFMLPYMLGAIYLALEYFKYGYPDEISYIKVLICGILAGFVLNIKFNSLGLFAGWMLMIILADILIGIRRDELLIMVGKAFLKGLTYIGGMILATIPWIIYLAIHSAVDDYFRVYIYLNVFVYQEQNPLPVKLYNMCKIIYNKLLDNKIVLFMIILGFAFFILRALLNALNNKADKNYIIRMLNHESRDDIANTALECLSLVVMASILLMGIFIGGVELPYYITPITSFTCVGFIALGIILEIQLTDIELGSVLPTALCVISLVISVVYVYFMSGNVHFMRYSKSDLVQYQFAQIIKDSGVENPTLLNVGCLDCGLYTTTGIVPTVYYFQTQTIKLSNISEIQEQAIVNGEVDFIVSRDYIPDVAEENYELVGEMEQNTDYYEFTYYLLQKKAAD
jgi:hypothetical protein